MSTASGNYGGGWTCSTCRQFVPFGSLHSCGGTPMRMSGGGSEADQLAQVLMALGRIEQLLRALTEKAS